MAFRRAAAAEDGESSLATKCIVVLQVYRRRIGSKCFLKLACYSWLNIKS